MQPALEPVFLCLKFMITLRIPTDADVKALADNLRDSDRQELEASFKGGVQAAIAGSVDSSAFCRAAILNGRVIGIFGLRELSVNEAMPWMLGTDELALNKKVFVSLVKKHLDQWFSLYSTLSNYVDYRNTLSIRWLKALGFSVSGKYIFPHSGQPFYKFSQTVN